MDLKTRIPILTTTNVKSPKVAVNKETFNPPAKIAGSGLPKASIESNAVIKPRTDPRNPNTKPNKLESAASFNILCALSSVFFAVENPTTRNAKDISKQININDINNGPPSIKIFINTVSPNTLLRASVSAIIVFKFS